MSEISSFEVTIREIVREEINKITVPIRKEGPYAGHDRRKPAKKSGREGEPWSRFETETLSEAFLFWCADRSLKTGRSIKSISCKVRRMMYEKIIPTWEG